VVSVFVANSYAVLLDQFFAAPTFQIDDRQTQVGSATRHKRAIKFVDMTRRRELFTTPGLTPTPGEKRLHDRVRDEASSPPAAARQVPKMRQYYVFLV